MMFRRGSRPAEKLAEAQEVIVRRGQLKHSLLCCLLHLYSSLVPCVFNDSVEYPRTFVRCIGSHD